MIDDESGTVAPTKSDSDLASNPSLIISELNSEIKSELNYLNFDPPANEADRESVDLWMADDFKALEHATDADLVKLLERLKLGRFLPVPVKPEEWEIAGGGFAAAIEPEATIKFSVGSGSLGVVTDKTLSWDQLAESLVATSHGPKGSAGFYVGATFENGRRGNDSLVARTLLTIDIDSYQSGIDSLEKELKLNLKGLTWVGYSTASFEPDNAKIRVVIPLAEEIADFREYTARAQEFCADLNIAGIDPASWSAAQLMYYQTSESKQHWSHIAKGEALTLPDVEYKIPESRSEASDLHHVINSKTERDLCAHLLGMDANDRDVWYKVLSHLAHSGPTGRRIAHKWASIATGNGGDGKPLYSVESTDAKLDEFTVNGKSHYAAIFNMPSTTNVNAKAEVMTVMVKPSANFTIGNHFMKHTLTPEIAAKMDKSKFIYPNLIPQGSISAYPSPANGGKTAIFTHVSCELAKDGFNVIYINADASPSQLKAQQVKADKYGFTILAPDATDGGGVTGLMKSLVELSQLDCSLSEDVLIVDTLKKFTDMLSKKDVSSFITLLRKIQAKGATICLLSHTNKYTGAEGELVYEGTGDLRNDVDNLVYLYSTLAEEGVREVTTAPDKTRDTFKSISFRIRFGHFGVEVDPLKEVLPCFSNETREAFTHCLEAFKSNIRSTEALVKCIAAGCIVGDNKARSLLKELIEMAHSPLVRTKDATGKGFTFRVKSEGPVKVTEF